MQVTSIKANGIGWHSPAHRIKSQLVTQIGLYKMRFTDKEIFSKFPDEGWGYLQGRRYNTNEDVAVRIMSAIVDQARKEYIEENGASDMSSDNMEILLEGIITAWFETLSASEIDILITDGLRECASADHWYTYEKEWD